jgi:hypothetical protein
MILALNKQNWEWLYVEENEKEDIYFFRNLDVDKIINKLISLSDKFYIPDSRSISKNNICEILNNFKDKNNIHFMVCNSIYLLSPKFSYNYYYREGDIKHNVDDGFVELKILFFEARDNVDYVYRIRLGFYSDNWCFYICEFSHDHDDDFKITWPSKTTKKD